MFIDSHVHCRDEEQAYKETIAHSLEVARDSGVSAIFDMPNTHRPVFDEERVNDRLLLAKAANVPEVFYGTFIGLTANEDQINYAVDTWKKMFPHVVGFKLFAGHSTGQLGVVKKEQQAIVYQTLAERQYSGVLFVHAEKESEMNDDINVKFNPENPFSHCIARPPKAEYESVRDQIDLARKANFEGKLHIAHVSHYGTVDLINSAKSDGLDISCGVCPHHLMFSYEMMNRPNGLLWKMNPPLRARGVPSKMLELLRNGLIDWVETDHAPHGNRLTKNLDEKLKSPHMSGIPGLAAWPFLIYFLKMNGFAERKINEITFDTADQRFGIGIKKNTRPLRERSGDYCYDPFEIGKDAMDFDLSKC